MTTIAVFDFDGTLVRCDSFVRFIVFCFGRWRTALGFVLFSPLLLLMTLRIVSGGLVKQKMFSFFFRHWREEDFRKAGGDFLQRLNSHTDGQMADRLQWHQAQGHRIYVVSASMEAWVRPWCEERGVSRVVCTMPEVDASGRLTGGFATKNCKGREKVNRFLALEPDRDTYRLVVYGDSRGDREMMALADEAHKVN